MITHHDEEVLNELKGLLGSLCVDPDFAETIDRVVRNLHIAPFCYKPCSGEDIEKRFYTAECECGWWGSSKYLVGGDQIADTGGYDDCYCPVCLGTDIEEKAEVESGD